jgi:hypothetical protein
MDFYVGGYGKVLLIRHLQSAIPGQRRRRVAGSLRTCLLNAATTTAVSLLGTLISMRKRECRSTSVAIQLFSTGQQIPLP